MYGYYGGTHSVELPERNLGLDLVRVTESAAIAAARWQGRGDKVSVDQAAVDGMRLILGNIDIAGTIVIGEGEKDEAPMLHNGESVGTGNGPAMDVAVDPVDGTTLTSEGMPGAVAVIAISEKGTMYAPGSLVYMDKIAVGPAAAGSIDLEAPVAHNLAQVAKALDKDVADVTAIMLSRPRNTRFIDAAREAGARIRLIRDGDVAGAIATAQPESGIDILFGIGGSPEAVIAAGALTCMEGEMQCKLWPRDDREREYANDQGLDLDEVLTTRSLVNSDNVFFAATDITTGELLDGVLFSGDKATTHSVVMRSKTGSIRSMRATHDFTKLRRLSALMDS
ncbi:MAG: class II fructose-bisphosphatase [Acidimicrobiia bacterium]